MARKGLRQQTHRGFDTAAQPSIATPRACPVCNGTPEDVKGKNGHLVLQTHLMEKHHPGTPCRRGHGGTTWKLDWDAVVNHQPTLWYCAECGFYFKAD
jgi:hypothetical protein